MTLWLSGMRIDADRLNDHTVEDSTTSGVTAATGWSVTSFSGKRVSGITTVEVFVSRTGADVTQSAADSGNISGDPLMCTLPGAWTPPELSNAAWGNGSVDGECTIGTDGQILLRSISGNTGIATGTNVRVTAMWISENDGIALSAGPTDITSYAEAALFWVVGAVGNGTTDDGPVIQTALDQAAANGGGLVVIPAGHTYGVGTFLHVSDNTTIWAYGATLKAIGTSAGLLRNFTGSELFNGYAGHSHIQVLGGIWDGNASDGVTGTVTAETDVLNFVHCADITVRDVTVRNVSSAHALEFNSTDGGRAINCRFEGYRDNSGTSSRQFSEAVQIDLAKSGSSSIGNFDNTASKNIVVQGCYFGPSTRLGVFGRAVGSHTVVAGVTFDNIQVVGNRIDGTLQEGVYGYGWRRAVIADNIITSTGYSGIQVTQPDPATTAITQHTVDIHGNTIEASGTDSAIRVLGYATSKIAGVSVAGNVIKSITGNAIHAEHCSGPSIAGNQVDTTSSTAIYAHYSDAATITGNTIRSAGSNGINVSGTMGATVAGNTVDTTTSNYGIFVGQGADATTNGTDAVISGNTLRSPASSGIRLSTNATRCLVIANTMRKLAGAATSALSMAASATSCTVVDNDFSGNSWSASTAMSVSTAAPVTGPGGMQALPGSNLVDTDLTPVPALEAAMSPTSRYETTSRLRCGTSSTPTSGSLYLVPIWLPKGLVVSNISFTSGGTAATSPTNYWFTLHDSARVALARTADQTTTAWAANTTKTLAVAQTTAGSASTYTTLYSGLFYLGFMIAAGTVPSISGEGTLNATLANTSPGFGPTNTAQTTPPTVTAGAFTAAAFSGSGILAYGYTT